MQATSSTQHEQASVAMFHHMLEKNQHVREEFKRSNLSIEEHEKFVADLIMGKPGEKSPQVSILLHFTESIFVNYSSLVYCTSYIGLFIIIHTF